MDPEIVDVFVCLGQRQPEFAPLLNPVESLARLAQAVGSGVKPAQLVEKSVLAGKQVA
jgi:hypothetical protein